MLNKRCIEIIEELRKNNYTIFIKEMAEKFGVTERSIRYDIENINYYFSKFNLNEIEKQSKGIYTLEEEDKKIEELLKNMSQRFYVFTSYERKEFIEEKFLFFEENRLIDLAETLDISMSTIKIDLKEVKIFFIENGLNLNFYSKQGILLEGNEEKIRMLQLRFLNKYLEINSENILSLKKKETKTYLDDIIYEDLKEIFEKINLKNIYRFVKRIEKKLDATISDEAFTILRFYIVIMLNRIKNNKIILQREMNKKFLMETKEFEIINKEKEFLEEQSKIKIEENEVLLLTELFLGSHSYNFNSSFFENWIELEILVNKLIKDVSDILNINLTQDKALIDGLLNHLKPAYYRIRNNIKFENKIYEDVKLLYEELYEKVKIVSKKYLEKYIGKDIPEEEIAFLTIHFKTAIDRKVNSQRKTKNIIIVCGLGYGSSKLIAQKLLEKYDVNIIATLPYHKFLEIEDYEDIDFIITTLEIEDKLEYTFPIIKVHPILTKEDKILLESYGLSENQRKISLNQLMNIIKEETNILNEKELIKKLKNILKYKYIDDIEKQKIYSLSELLPLENIKVIDKVKDWKEAIKVSSMPLQIGNYIKDEYIDEMIKNVEQNGSYMVVNDVVALPHARTNGLVNKTGMSLLVLKDEVTFPGEKRVKILLTFSSYDQKEHIDALSKFVTILEEGDFINKIKKLGDVEIKRIIDNE
ncbi:BglG family transcription antiterminator [Fusobacterium perfoetens]|uniref:BglG family transcription antiterminator n=1 Tax=Fusobacterium perfoetens TaxID=852 RepID=UPI001F2E8A44|nr:BglG family transcription antiterminator [Fusobacterium perfoetens]MCF2611945.1 BglG family transcription antiterminator [Fusobacterium perfoetens]